MSNVVDRGGGHLPAEWLRLERAAEEAALALGRWTRRGREAEDEVERLRAALEDLAGNRPADVPSTSRTLEPLASPDPELMQEIRRLKAENAALRSRMLQARKRLSGLMQRLAALELES